MAKPFAGLAAEPVSLDETPLPFGKWKGRTPEQVADVDPGYIMWLYENVQPKRCSRGLYLACEMDVREAEADMQFEYDSERDD